MNTGPGTGARDLSAKAVKPTARHRPPTLVACGTLALALALTACGGSSKPSTSTRRSTAIRSAAPSRAIRSAVQSTAESSTAASSASGRLSGTWQGTADSSAGQDVIDLTVVFTQQGSTLSGSITTGSVCFRDGTVSGTNNGATVGFVGVSGSQEVTFNATSRGRHIDGTYQAVTSCGNDNGTFELAGPS